MNLDSDLLSIQELRSKVELAHQAFQQYRRFTQEQVDRIVEAMAEAARQHARRLAELAVQETGYGNATDKLAKNLLTADLLPRTIRGMKTIGVLREDTDRKIVEVATPMGVVGAILPTTNPTSTAIFKSIIALKSGNAIVHSPHPYARQCTCETIELLHRAAVAAGAPEGIIQCLTLTSQETTQQLMKHPKIAVILATGGAGLVRAAYASGKPAFGVGPGNVPVLLDTTANIPEAVGLVVDGKSFDYGTVCSSEQSLVCEEALRATVLSELRARNAHLCSESESKALESVLIGQNGRINPQCVGKSPQTIAALAGFTVAPQTRILACEIQGVGKEHPLSAEKLSPVLSLLFVRDFATAVDNCEQILRFGGLGHTCSIFSKDESRIREYGLRMPAFRVLVNTASPQGSTGITTNLPPSMTLGCGAVAGNITSDNVGPQHLINVKRIAYVARKVSEAFTVPADTVPATSTSASPSSGSTCSTTGAATGSSCGCQGSPTKTQPTAASPRITGATQREAVAEAVEQYLRSRNIAVSLGGQTSAPSASAPTASYAGARQAAPPSAAVGVASVVDRFLATRKPAAPKAPLNCGCPLPSKDAPIASAPSSCGVGNNRPSQAATGAGAGNDPKQALPKVEMEPAVDFVCEDDVRRAMLANRKIRLKSNAILTPSARDLGESNGVFVREGQ